MNLSINTSVDERLAAVARLAELGVTWVVVNPPRERFEYALEAIQRFGQDVVARTA
jgi:hypothetical protein